MSHLCKLTQVSAPFPSNIHRVYNRQTQSDDTHTKKKKLASDGGCRQEDRQGVTENKINAAETNVQKKSVTLSFGWVFVTATLNCTWENWKPTCCVTPVFSPSFRNNTESRLPSNHGDGVSLFYGVLIPPPLPTSLFIYHRYKMKMNSAFDSALGSWWLSDCVFIFLANSGLYKLIK